MQVYTLLFEFIKAILKHWKNSPEAILKSKPLLFLSNCRSVAKSLFFSETMVFGEVRGVKIFTTAQTENTTVD